MSDATLEQVAGDPHALVYRAELDRGAELHVILRESAPGASDWAASDVRVRSGSSSLTAGRLRALPYGRHLALALELVRARSAPPAVFAKPGDPPRAFREDRRGNAPRSEVDYARLAHAAYIVTTDERIRRDLPKRWSADFGRAVGTWQNNLTTARDRFVRRRRATDPPLDDPYACAVLNDGEQHVGHYLTGEAIRLLHGDDFLEPLEPDACEIQAAEEKAAQQQEAERERAALREEAELYLQLRRPDATPTERARADFEDDRLRRQGGDPQACRERAERVLSGLHLDSGPESPGGQ